ncbi:hypothetical protein RHMOL_Rhmol12G0054000 [Rhododendron molle]|uniref:Uncharacterized protein n=1 Tax=Rhododendron molle TaxID=49168 RepID=A0ACC0LEJ7_RHOML|nr:hypothetical protein RHMOL_Rhmol12G0054000 [Rhododendron molle]
MERGTGGQGEKEALSQRNRTFFVDNLRRQLLVISFQLLIVGGLRELGMFSHGYFGTECSDDVTISLFPLDRAVKIRDNAKNMRRTVDWKEVECPEQPSTVECGFFVMRFMKDLVADPSMLCRRDIGFFFYIVWEWTMQLFGKFD